ncbi:MAG: cyclic nucleotide-binding domain-containing protein, partial [Thermoanaerobaculaceae bacterium]|nr:cyclic nucleotide-binding domain-containing protein [Thermoanaerobaculaceae bacterium]
LSISSDPNNLKVAVGFLGKGDYVGLGALVQGPPQPNSLVAQKNTRILFIPKEKLEHLISTEPELGLRLYRSIAEHLVNTMMKMSQKK